MAILGIFRHLCKKLMKCEYLLKEDKMILTLTVLYFFNAFYLNYVHKWNEICILFLDGGHLTWYYIIIKAT